jgi:hypothetical protein
VELEASDSELFSAYLLVCLRLRAEVRARFDDFFFFFSALLEEPAL